MIDDLDRLRRRLDSLEFRRINVLAWRDLDDPSAGGSEIYLDRILTEWAGLGVDILVRTSAVRDAPRYVRRNGYAVTRGGGRVLVYPRSIIAEVVGNRRGGPDLTLEVWNGVPWLTPLWARRPHAALLHHVHTPMWRASVNSVLARAGWLVETKLAPGLYRGVRIFTPSASAKAEIVEALRLVDDQIEVVPPGVDARFRSVCALSEAPLVAVVGRLVRAKRVDLVIRAVAQARMTVPGVRLTVVGDGPERARLRALAAQLGGANWVRFVGRVSDQQLVQLYGSAWLMVSASATEGWGMTVTEAAGCGTPAVVVDSVGLRDSVIADVTGLVVSQGELAWAIGHLLTDHFTRQRLAEGARQRASLLTWRRTSHQVLASLLDVFERQIASG